MSSATILLTGGAGRHGISLDTSRWRSLRQELIAATGWRPHERTHP